MYLSICNMFKRLSGETLAVKEPSKNDHWLSSNFSLDSPFEQHKSDNENRITNTDSIVHYLNALGQEPSD